MIQTDKLYGREIPYTWWHIARNADGKLNLFDSTPKCEWGKWFTYHDGERFYGMKLNHTMCEEITFENSPHKVQLVY